MPARPAPVSPAPVAPAPRRWRTLFWLLPAVLLALLVILAVALALEPTRSTLLALLPAPAPTAPPPGRGPATNVPTLPVGPGETASAAPAEATAASAETKPPPTATAVATASAPAAATTLPTATPPATATPLPTATPIPTATPVPQAVVQSTVNLRAGPSQDFAVLRQLAPGESVQTLGRNEAGNWLQVRAPDGAVGWVASSFLDASAYPPAEIPVVNAPTLPPCSVAIDGALRGAPGRPDLGCPRAAARSVWTAWEPFQNGAMLWRNDTDQVTVVYNGGGWRTLPDQWDQQTPPPARGQPPAGLQAPVRGFGWIWGNGDEVFAGLGWATDEEKGVCMLVQDFERGFVFAKSNAVACTDRQGEGHTSRAAELPPLRIAVYGNGAGWRSY